MIDRVDANRSAEHSLNGPNQQPIAFLCHPYHRGGVTRWMIDAATAWVARGRDCWFVVPRPRNTFVSGAGRPTMYDMIAALPPVRGPTLAGPLVGDEFEFGTEAYRARCLARSLQRAVPPGVHVIVSDDPASWRAVSLLRGRNPLIGVLHADDPSYYALSARFHHDAAAIVGVSRRVVWRARGMLGRSRVVTSVIPCGIPLPPLALTRDGGRESLRLVWVGRFSEAQKRVSDLPAIAKSLKEAGFSFRLDIIGDGEDAGEIRARVEQAGVADEVRFHGWMPSAIVLRMLSQSDLMLIPSNFEGMPVAAMEALACGCAVVGSDACGLEEYVDEPHARDALWIHPRGDVEAAKRAAVAAAAVPKERRRAAARLLAEREFSIERCLDRYEQLLSALPTESVVPASLRSWHIADVASRGVALARRMRADRL